MDTFYLRSVMSKKRLPKSQRKHIRREKARIRREVLDLKKQKELINQLYEKFLKKPVPKKPTLKKPTLKKPVSKKPVLKKPFPKKSFPKKKTPKKPTKIQGKTPQKTG